MSTFQIYMMYMVVLVLSVLIISWRLWLRTRLEKKPVGERCRYQLNGQRWKGTILSVSKNTPVLVNVQPDKQPEKTHVVWRSSIKPVFFEL